MVSKKKVCEECGRILRTRCFKLNPVLNKKICYICDRRIGHNKYYKPDIKTNKGKNFYKMELKQDEKQALLNELLSHGLSEQQANYRINNRQKYLRWFEKRRMIKPKTNNELTKRFLEGLNQR